MITISILVRIKTKFIYIIVIHINKLFYFIKYYNIKVLKTSEYFNHINYTSNLY